MYKLAGEVNRARLQELSKVLQPGDIVNFETRFGDVAQESGVRKAVKDMMISKPIAAVTGSPQTHTAILEGIDPDGNLRLIHNYEQGQKAVVHRVTPEQFEEFARSRDFHFYRPQGATPAQGMTAAQRAARAAGASANYSYTDLGLSAARQGAERVKEIAPVAGAGVELMDTVSNIKRTAANCDPASGFCSHLAADAWSEPLGGMQNAQRTMGTNVTNINSSLPVTPGSIHRAAEAGKLQRVGVYTPANPAKGVMSGIGSRIKSVATSKVPGLGAIGQAAKKITGSIIGARLP